MSKSKSEKVSPGGGGAYGFHVFFLGATTIMAVAIIVQRIPNPIAPVYYELPAPPSLTGSLSANEKLKDSNLILKSINGPESILFYKDHMYTGTSDGKIMKINRDGEATVFVQFGSGQNISTVGRPLGLRIDSTSKFLYAVDAYLGLFKVELDTGKSEKLFPFDNQFKVTFFDDLDILPNGDVIISEASAKHHFHQLVLDFLESSGKGRLLKVDLEKRRFEIIRDGLFFANGVQKDLRDNGQSVLVAESQRNRILRVFVSGERKGETEMFSENLPGMPDNIRASEKGDGYWIALGEIRTKDHDSCTIHLMSKAPFVRLLLAKLIPLSWFSQIPPTQYSMVIKLDLEGRIVESLHDTNGSTLPLLSQVTEHSGSLFFGNFYSPGIGYLNRHCRKENNCFFKDNYT